MNEKSLISDLSKARFTYDRQQAAQKLANTSSKEAIEALIVYGLYDSYFGVRLDAIRSLRIIYQKHKEHQATIYSELLKKLDEFDCYDGPEDTSIYIRIEAVKQLSLISDDSLTQELEKRLYDRSSIVRLYMSAELLKRGDYSYLINAIETARIYEGEEAFLSDVFDSLDATDFSSVISHCKSIRDVNILTYILKRMHRLSSKDTEIRIIKLGLDSKITDILLLAINAIPKSDAYRYKEQLEGLLSDNRLKDKTPLHSFIESGIFENVLFKWIEIIKNEEDASTREFLISSLDANHPWWWVNENSVNESEEALKLIRSDHGATIAKGVDMVGALKEAKYLSVLEDFEATDGPANPQGDLNVYHSSGVAIERIAHTQKLLYEHRHAVRCLKCGEPAIESKYRKWLFKKVYFLTCAHCNSSSALFYSDE